MPQIPRPTQMASGTTDGASRDPALQGADPSDHTNTAMPCGRGRTRHSSPARRTLCRSNTRLSG